MKVHKKCFVDKIKDNLTENPQAQVSRFFYRLFWNSFWKVDIRAYYVNTRYEFLPRSLFHFPSKKMIFIGGKIWEQSNNRI